MKNQDDTDTAGTTDGSAGFAGGAGDFVDPDEYGSGTVGPDIDAGADSDGADPYGSPGEYSAGAVGEIPPPFPTRIPPKRMGAAALLTIAAIVALMASPWSSAFAFAYMGIVCGMVAMTVSVRATAATAFAAAGAVFVGVLVSDSVTLSVLWMAVLACLIAWASRFGAAVVASLIAAQAAIVVVSGHVVAFAPAPFDQPHTAAGALVVAAFVLGGGLVTVIASVLFLRGYGSPFAPRLSPADSWWFLATVLPLTVVGTWVCVEFFPGTHAWWLLLTIYVVLLPLPEEATARMYHRALGTVAGALVVMAITLIGPHPMVFHILALVAALGTLATTTRSYSLNAAFLTATVLLMATPAATNPLLLESERIGLTLAGAAAGYALLLGNTRLRRRIEARAVD